MKSTSEQDQYLALQNTAKTISKFSFEGSFLEAKPWGGGHINDTYMVHFRKLDGDGHRYILQRINQEVFKRPDELMANIVAITNHIRKKIFSTGGNPDQETLSIIPTKNGNSFHLTDQGDYWRAYRFIEGAQSYRIAENMGHVYTAAYAFGKFQRFLNDFPANQLHETIVDFHHTARRYEHFLEVVEADLYDRVKDVGDEIAFVKERESEVSVIVDLLSAGKIPTRVTHNDTKFDNVMIDNQTGKGICVVDLDTVMPGSMLYDFGDAIRSISNTGDEDERDLSKVHFNIDVFENYVRGYQSALQDTCTAGEIEYLAFSARLLTLECGIRFLTDHLDGDQYFKIHRPNQNLDRCRTQFKLVEEMEEQYDEMLSIVKKYFSSS